MSLELENPIVDLIFFDFNSTEWNLTTTKICSVFFYIIPDWVDFTDNKWQLISSLNIQTSYSILFIYFWIFILIRWKFVSHTVNQNTKIISSFQYKKSHSKALIFNFDAQKRTVNLLTIFILFKKYSNIKRQRCMAYMCTN